MNAINTYTAFEENKLIFRGALEDIVVKIKRRIGKIENSSILVFSDSTGKSMDFNFQGTEKDVLKRLEIFTSEEGPIGNFGPGRPKLGVISREISLLPRHWEWLATQSGGASSTLRKLVDEAKKKEVGTFTVKQAQERVYKFMSVMAGDLKGYEEALRALYKKDEKKFLAQTEEWPRDVRNHSIELAKSVFE